MSAAQAVDDPMDEVWCNEEYDCQVRYNDHERGRAGPVWLSIKRIDRDIARDWRHLQAIKNDVIGWEREAIELFPAESRLVDGANQTHLWVMPAGVRIEIGFNERSVHTDEEMREQLKQVGVGPGKARQRPWQPNISTGPDYRP